MKRTVLLLLAVLVVGGLVWAWLASAGTGYQQDCQTVYVDGVKCTGCSRCYEPRRVGTDESGKIPPWEFSGEGWSEAEQAITHISISSELIVNGSVADQDSKEADNAAYVHSSGYATGSDWWECVYRSQHDFRVKYKPVVIQTEAGWASKNGK